MKHEPFGFFAPQAPKVEKALAVDWQFQELVAQPETDGDSPADPIESFFKAAAFPTGAGSDEAGESIQKLFGMPADVREPALLVHKDKPVTIPLEDISGLRKRRNRGEASPDDSLAKRAKVQDGVVREKIGTCVWEYTYVGGSLQKMQCIEEDGVRMYFDGEGNEVAA